jgi:hypothetical protein
MITQPRWGIFGQRYGSFAGKAGTSGPHPVGKITQPRWGIFGQRYGSFEKGIVPAVTSTSSGEAFAFQEELQMQQVEEEELILLVLMWHENVQ